MTYVEPRCGECKAANAELEIRVYRRGRMIEQLLMCAHCAVSYERLTFGNSPIVGLVELVVECANQHADRVGASSRLGCPVCGITLSEVVSGGAPGCGSCYFRFAAEIDGMISEVHGAVVHRGKAPV